MMIPLSTTKIFVQQLPKKIVLDGDACFRLENLSPRVGLNPIQNAFAHAEAIARNIFDQNGFTLEVHL
jgi:hypothetical protein